MKLQAAADEVIQNRLTALGGDVIGKDHCKKLRHCIMNIDSAKNVDELLALTIAL